jgi:hypothetical protein
MSFADLRNARQSKLSKSYVNTANAPLRSPIADSSKPVGGGSARMENDAEHAAATLDAMYKSLPNFVEIRSSAMSGRGIWMKDRIVSGTLRLS